MARKPAVPFSQATSLVDVREKLFSHACQEALRLLKLNREGLDEVRAAIALYSEPAYASSYYLFELPHMRSPVAHLPLLSLFSITRDHPPSLLGLQGIIPFISTSNCFRGGGAALVCYSFEIRDFAIR